MSNLTRMTTIVPAQPGFQIATFVVDDEVPIEDIKPEDVSIVVEPVVAFAVTVCLDEDGDQEGSRFVTALGIDDEEMTNDSCLILPNGRYHFLLDRQVQFEHDAKAHWLKFRQLAARRAADKAAAKP